MNHTSLRAFMVTLLSLIAPGCAQRTANDARAPRSAPSAAAPATPVQMWVGVEAWTRVGGRPRWDTVRQGQQLRSGDRLSLHVRVDEPAYVYVYYIDARRKIQPLHATRERLEPGREVRVPQLPELLELDQSIGEENLLVLSRRDRAISDADLTRGLQRAIDTGLLSCKDVKPGQAPVGSNLSCHSLGSEHTQLAFGGKPRPGHAAAGPRTEAAAAPRTEEAGPPLPPGFDATLGFFKTTGAQVQVDAAEGLSVFRFRLDHTR